MEINLETIERLLQLMTSYKMEAIEIGDLKLRKTRHFTIDKDDATKEKEKMAEILFASTPGAKPPPDFDISRMFQPPFESPKDPNS